ncbi:hypothetical protein DNTS_022898, partial [Danionella cerebrum]
CRRAVNRAAKITKPHDRRTTNNRTCTELKLRGRKKDGDSKSSQRALANASPDSKCPICLDHFKNVASLDRCLHQFCFPCIREWSKNKAECPLCKQPFRSIFHSVKGKNDFKEFVLCPAETTPGANQPQRLLRPRVLRGRSRRSQRTQEPTPSTSSPLPMGDEIMFDELSANQDVEQMLLRLTRRRERRQEEELSLRRLREQDVITFRRALYRTGIRVRNNRDPNRQRDISASFLRQNPACFRRILPWIQRELMVLYGSHGSLVNIVQNIIISRIMNYNMEDPVIRDELRPFLLARTDHFLYELVSFVRSNVNMEEYDQQADEDDGGESEVVSSNQSALQEPIAVSGSECLPSHSAWGDETPGTSYSSFLPTPSLSQEEGADPGSSATLPLEALDTNVGTSSNLDCEEDECLIVGYVKPMAERTPELVQLSSDSSAEEADPTDAPEKLSTSQSGPALTAESLLQPQSGANFPPVPASSKSLEAVAIDSPSLGPCTREEESDSSSLGYEPRDHSRCDSHSERSFVDKPSGKRKYKTRHLERVARKQNDEGHANKEKRRRKKRRRSKERSRSPSIEIIYEKRAPDPDSVPRKNKKHRKRRKQTRSPTVITIDSDSDRTIDCLDRVMDVIDQTVAEVRRTEKNQPIDVTTFSKQESSCVSDSEYTLNLSNCLVDVIEDGQSGSLQNIDLNAVKPTNPKFTDDLEPSNSESRGPANSKRTLKMTDCFVAQNEHNTSYSLSQNCSNPINSELNESWNKSPSNGKNGPEHTPEHMDHRRMDIIERNSYDKSCDVEKMVPKVRMEQPSDSRLLESILQDLEEFLPENEQEVLTTPIQVERTSTPQTPQLDADNTDNKLFATIPSAARQLIWMNESSRRASRHTASAGNVVELILSEESRSVTRAAQMFLDQICSLEERGWFQAFKDILLCAEYTGLHSALLEWNFLPLEELHQHRKLLERIEPSLTKHIKPGQLLKLSGVPSLPTSLDACELYEALELLESDEGVKSESSGDSSGTQTLTTFSIQYREEPENENESNVNFPEKPSNTPTAESGAQGEHKLREYQKELMSAAIKGQNTIICAPTGSGKTIVALGICDDHIQQFPERAKIVFLATKVDVYEQQYKLFLHYFSRREIRVTGMCGDMPFSLRQLLETHDIVVMTAQILVNALQKQEVTSLGMLTLILLDECHNTTGKHPYNNIMTRYCDEKLAGIRPLPQIVGLTASVGVGSFKTKEDAATNISQLCANMDSLVISTVNTHLDDLRTYVHTPE